MSGEANPHSEDKHYWEDGMPWPERRHPSAVAVSLVREVCHCVRLDYRWTAFVSRSCKENDDPSLITPGRMFQL